MSEKLPSPPTYDLLVDDLELESFDPEDNGLAEEVPTERGPAQKQKKRISQSVGRDARTVLVDAEAAALDHLVSTSLSPAAGQRPPIPEVLSDEVKAADKVLMGKPEVAPRELAREAPSSPGADASQHTNNILDLDPSLAPLELEAIEPLHRVAPKFPRVLRPRKGSQTITRFALATGVVIVIALAARFLGYWPF